MRDETAVSRIFEELSSERPEEVLSYGGLPPGSAPESFAYARTDDPRKMSVVYDLDAGVWIQVGSDSMREAAGL